MILLLLLLYLIILTISILLKYKYNKRLLNMNNIIITVILFFILIINLNINMKNIFYKDNCVYDNIENYEINESNGDNLSNFYNNNLIKNNFLSSKSEWDTSWDTSSLNSQKSINLDNTYMDNNINRQTKYVKSIKSRNKRDKNFYNKINNIIKLK